ncbi:MAG: MFS transporter [Xanthobacteraceae bacterium]|jgi:predicted MFS family arabinose efflux permease
MNRLLNIVGVVTFATSLFTRAVDPVIPQIATSLWVDPATAALLSTAFALPYAVLQPLLGPLADVIGKARMMTICLVLLTAASLASAFAESFAVLLTLRMLSGIVSGGIFPAAMAFAADLAPIGQRQVALSRILFAGMSGNLLGASAAGIVADLIGWRGVFLLTGAIGALALLTAIIGFRTTDVKSTRIPFKSVPAGYRAILANPRAKVCFGAVFFEGIFIFGVFPYVALLLLAGGEARASIAGLVIAGFSLGGVLYAMVVGALLEMFGQRRIMMTGGLVAAIALSSVALHVWWPLALLAFGLLGLGFYLLHGSIQVFMTELAPEARGSSAALHSSSFFLGQAIGPIFYGLGLAWAGQGPTLVIAAIGVALVALISVRLLHAPGPT